MDEEELFDDPHCFFEKVIPYPDLFSIEWRAIIFDECHENGILNPKAQTGAGARGLRADNRFLLSGTPMGGREVRMFEILQFLRPDVFTSKWRFAEQYLEVNTSTFYLKGGRGATGTSRKIGGIKRCYRHRIGTLPRPPKGECAECDQYELNFYQTLNPYVLRRTKDEVLPDLPPKIRTDIWVPFASERHRKQYETFADDAEVRLNNERITATNVISEYVRLSQFAWGEYDDGMVPTTKSAKLQALDEKLEELGVYDPSSGEQAVIFSQYKSIVDVVHEWLARERLGTAVGKLTGDTTKKGERAALKESFQGDGGLRALVISTKAGGTSLTLDRASNVFILDETWNPDNEEQAEDRCHRASRIHQVNIYRIRTKDTMDEFRMELAWDKAVRNSSVLDLRRIKLKSDA